MNARIDAARSQTAAERHGTPLYIYDSQILQERCRALRDVLSGADLYYSLKANPNPDVAAALREFGCRVEVASGGELERAVQAGYPPDTILFIGPGKTRHEIRRAAELGVTRFVVDNEDELRVLRDEAAVCTVTVRINPAFEATGGKLSMGGGKPKQFGVDRPRISEFVGKSRSMGIEVTGLHYYLGTRFLDARDIIANTQQIIADAASIVAECELPLELLDMGGGFGVPYFENEDNLDLDVLTQGIQTCIAEARSEFPGARLAFESGRYLTAESGQLVLEVLACKWSYGTRFCVCDGGTNVNLAAIGTGSLGKRNFPNYLVPRGPRAATENPPGPVTVTGPLCTPDDTILKAVQWEHAPQAGDLVVLASVGAYGPSASPHSFLGHAYPTEVLI
ncbi:hypothetical protein M3697_17285 [Janibacter melonis]|uniref:hypothetical protein n=1 Tax=Janibacter melonis TaxID=262209 RepID=UPI002044A1ED|nr:hypothetical protein [Janibacter melonis]MCM3556837.1 hypothetical protein [Janibacter melonis]